MSNQLAKEVAKNLLKINAVFLKPNDPFTWASGIKSPIYCDNRLTLSYPETRKVVEDGLAEVIKEYFPTCEVVMGTSTAGIPHAAYVSEILNMPMGYVRGGAKDHGRGNQIEGVVPVGKNVVVIEDLISTAGSSIEVVEVLREAGCNVLGIASIFTYNLKKGKERLEQANVINHSLSNFETLVEVAAEENYISKDDIKKVLEEHRAPVITEPIPFFEDLSTKRMKFESFTIKLDDSTTATVDVPLTETMYHNVARYDFMQERRKEFAMEGQAWLDLKRLYYRDPIMAEKFLVQMDRGIQMSAIPNAIDLAEVEAGYARKAVVNALNNILATTYPEKWSADANAKAEETILIDNFTTNNYWFLPIPVSAQSGLDGGAAKDFVNEVERGTYPY